MLSRPQPDVAIFRATGVSIIADAALNAPRERLLRTRLNAVFGAIRLPSLEEN
jgi:hypothetical protein